MISKTAGLLYVLLAGPGDQPEIYGIDAPIQEGNHEFNHQKETH